MRSALTLALGAAAICAACGGGRAYPAPAAPEAAVRAFMNGVRDSNLVVMGASWGSERGPATSYMDREQLIQRLTIMREFLVHERWEFVTGNATLPVEPHQRILQVRLYRNGCTPVVPFTVTRYRTGWLVWEMDLEAAGNPQRICGP